LVSNREAISLGEAILEIAAAKGLAPSLAAVDLAA
jgi:hypothetical protein